jgi:hypothetical protein
MSHSRPFDHRSCRKRPRSRQLHNLKGTPSRRVGRRQPRQPACDLWYPALYPPAERCCHQNRRLSCFLLKVIGIPYYRLIKPRLKYSINNPLAFVCHPHPATISFIRRVTMYQTHPSCKRLAREYQQLVYSSFFMSHNVRYPPHPDSPAHRASFFICFIFRSNPSLYLVS